jgi:peptidoglycan/xylan/chitin deacetylase (PgdA/CDA1 family)
MPTDAGSSRPTARQRPRQLAAQLLESTPVVQLARIATRGRLAVLAYHDVTDPVAFAHQLDVIQEHHRPVTGEEVAAAVQDRQQLPRGATWLTFDDAHAGVLRNALPLLIERSVPATLFVCPGVVDTNEAYWWQVLDAALARWRTIDFAGRTWSDRSIMTRLKRVPDSVRRATVNRLASELAESGVTVQVRQAESTRLVDWLAAGLEVGNHTWDHPCLDMCDDEQQRHQIVAADGWFRDVLGTRTRLFAYPNGNTAPISRQVLSQLGYAVTALFDHRISRASGPEVSRLRVDAAAPLGRFTAITSGAHSAAFALGQRFVAVEDTTGVPQ